MAPKIAASKDKNAKPKKVSAQQRAMEEAATEAEKLYRQHEEYRVRDEREDKVKRDTLFMGSAIEKERIRQDRELYKAVQKDFVDDELLAYRDYEKHARWEAVPNASRLPDVTKASEINTFLCVWRDSQIEHFDAVPGNTVIASKDMTSLAGAAANTGAESAANGRYRLLFLRGEQSANAAVRRKHVDAELAQCCEAYQVALSIKAQQDVAFARGDTEEMAFHCANLQQVYEHLMAALDLITVQALLYYDSVLDGQDGETLMRSLPPGDNPVVKYGLWVKVKEMTRSFTALVLPDVNIRVDPKSNAVPKLPKALGLSKENVAMRAYQLAFDPFSGFSSVGKEFYALDCTLKCDLLTFSNRPKQSGDWLLRADTEEAHTLHAQEYPPRSAEAQVEDPVLRISFEVPHTVVIRQPAMLVGKWREDNREWEPCSHTTFGATFGGTVRADPHPRRATFVTGELAHFALLQEKAFDAPFESWSLKPMSWDTVIFALEGHHRAEQSDREFKILIEDAKCKLLLPDDVELAQLRQEWLDPATLFRRLAQAGFNFVLSDEDARFVEGLVPKSKTLETKAYADIAHFCQYYAVANSVHNKLGEDPDMALFRLSKFARAPDEEDNQYNVSQAQSAWYSVRYRKEHCALARFTEDGADDLNVAEGHETHFNLHTMLLPLCGEELLHEQFARTNYLLRRCVFQLLCIVRPLSWG